MRQNFNQPIMTISSQEEFLALDNFTNDENYSQPNNQKQQRIDVPQFYRRVDIMDEEQRKSSTDEYISFITKGYNKMNSNLFKNLENEYELQLPDIQFLKEYNQANQDNPLTEEEFEGFIQFHELERHYQKYVAFKAGEGIDPGRNLLAQWDLLQKHPMRLKEIPPKVLAYINLKVEQLGRPLIRIFMRAIQNDPRTHVAFRPSKLYKQRRLKRLNFNLSELEFLQKRLKIENQVAQNQMQMLIQRETLKHDLIQTQKSIFNFESLREDDGQLMDVENQLEIYLDNKQTNDILTESSILCRKLRMCKNNEHRPLLKLKKFKSDLSHSQLPPPPTFPPWYKYNDCKIEDCQFNLFSQQCLLTPELVEVMDEQFQTMRQWKGSRAEWPECHLILREKENLTNSLRISYLDIVGVFVVGKSIVIGKKDDVLVIRKYHEDTPESRRINKKAVNISYLDCKTKRMSNVEGLRVDIEHFIYHKRKCLESINNQVDLLRRQFRKLNDCQKFRDRREKRKIIKKRIQKQKITQNLLKFRLKWEEIPNKEDKIIDREQNPQQISEFNKKENINENSSMRDLDYSQIKTNEKNEILQQTLIPERICAQTNNNKIILRRDPQKYFKEQQSYFSSTSNQNLITLCTTDKSTLKFKLHFKPESPQTLKLHPNLESQESYSLDITRLRYQSATKGQDE